MTIADLFDFLFPPAPTSAEAVLTPWIQESKRFQAFMVEYKTKVRKKLRLARSPEHVQDLLLELDVVRHLIEDRRCQVEYEKYGYGGERNPDLTVTFRTHTLLNLEATRVQIAQEDAGGRAEKLTRVVCEKMGQLVPQMLNCLVVAAEGSAMAEEGVSAAMKSLKLRVEQRESDLLCRLPFNTPATFFKQFQWLNGIILCSSGQDGVSKTVLWTNPQARHPLPSDLRGLLQRAISLTPTAEEDRGEPSRFTFSG